MTAGGEWTGNGGADGGRGVHGPDDGGERTCQLI